MNYALIAVNVFIFLLEFRINPFTNRLQYRPWVDHFMLSGVRPYLWQFVSYAFLHGGILHILGNMFFLYLFGNNVNDKLGNVGYLSFYLAGAVFSGIGHVLISQAGVLGASGAVAAVTGAYLVLFPQTLITVFYWIIFLFGAMEVPALYFIALKMILIDNVIARVTPNVAHDAHLAGYAFGILSMLVLLATGLISGSTYDLWAMVKRWNRRRVYRDAVSGGYDPYTGQTKRIKVKEVKKTPAQRKKDKRSQELRNEINKRIAERNLPAAADLYLELVNHDSDQSLPRKNLLDIANQLAGDNRHAEAALAYEKFLTHYGAYEYAEQVELMLGLIYSRYLSQPEQGIKHLKAACEKLTDPGQLKMCKDELEKLQN